MSYSFVAFILLASTAVATISPEDEIFCHSLPTGTTMHEIVARCASASVIEGQNSTHPGLIFDEHIEFGSFGANLERLQLPLHIIGSKAAGLVFPSLTLIESSTTGGCLKISDNQQLKFISLPKLKYVICEKGFLEISKNTVLETVGLANLEAVQLNALLIENNGIREMSFESLEILIASTVTVQENSALSKFKISMEVNEFLQIDELRFINNKEGFCPELIWTIITDAKVILDQTTPETCIAALEMIPFSAKGGISLLGVPEKNFSYLLTAIVIAITVIGAIACIAFIIHLRLKKSTKSPNKSEMPNMAPARGEEEISRGSSAEQSTIEGYSKSTFSMAPVDSVEKDESNETTRRGGTKWDDIVLSSGKILREFEGQVPQENSHMKGVLHRMREGGPLPSLEEIRRPTPPQPVESFQDLLDRGLRTPREFYGHCH